MSTFDEYNDVAAEKAEVRQELVDVVRADHVEPIGAEIQQQVPERERANVL